MRIDILEKAVSKETVWPGPGIPEWGDVMWALSLLYLDERVDEANQRLLELASSEQPFAYFGTVDYVRILALFNSKSPHFPGRLKPKVESAMKEVLWKWTTDFQKHYTEVLETYEEIEDDYPNIDTEEPEWLVFASENHDLIRRTAAYVFFSIIKDDADYRDRSVGNGASVEKNYHALSKHLKSFLRERATKGLWMEMGAGYAKYSYATIFNLYDLSPDPEMARLAEMFLDVALIEHAQISYSDGYRTGAMSRLARSDLETGGSMLRPMKLLFGEVGGLSTHSRVIETSSYQVPAIAYFLRAHADELPPIIIRNRMIGESAGPDLGRNKEADFAGLTFAISKEPALVNYTYKTPEYSMGGANQDPVGSDSGITRQDRWSGILFNDASRSRIVPMAETDNSRGDSSRVHDAYSKFQDTNLMVVRRMEKARYMGRLMVHFSTTLDRVEKGGWVFASNGRAFAAVRVLGGQLWDSPLQIWTDSEFLFPEDLFAPIVFLAGDLSDGFRSFESFQRYVLKEVIISPKANVFEIKRPNQLDVAYYVDGRLPEVGGEVIDLQPEWAYDSPFLRSDFDSYVVGAKWGPLRSIYDFSLARVEHSFAVATDKED